MRCCGGWSRAGKISNIASVAGLGAAGGGHSRRGQVTSPKGGLVI